MIKYLLFDYGGVILDLQKAHTLNAPQAISIMFGIPQEEAVTLWRSNSQELIVGRETPEEFLEKLRQITRSSKSQEELIKEWITLNTKQREHINWELLAVIQELNKKYRVYIFSDTFDVAMDDDLNKEINSIFEGSFVSFREGFRKPSVEAFQNVLNKIGAKPEECVFVDDTEKNIVAANELGIKSILYQSLEQLKEDLHQIGILSGLKF